MLAQTSPAFGKPDGDWQKQFIDARLGPLDRGETLVSLAPSLVKELVGDDPDARGHGAGARLHGRGSRGDLSRHHAGADGIRSAPCAEGDFGADAGAVGLEGQQCAGADDGEDGELHSIGATYVELEGVGHLANLERPDAFNAALGIF